jgi:hypothetical protein
MKLFWQLVCLFCLPALNYAQTALPFSADIDTLTIEKPFLCQIQQPPAKLGSPANLPID